MDNFEIGVDNGEFNVDKSRISVDIIVDKSVSDVDNFRDPYCRAILLHMICE